MTIWPHSGCADETLHSQILVGQDALYHGRFDEAVQHFATLTQTYPTDPKSHFFLALTYRWLTRVDPDSPDHQKQFERTMQASIDVAQALLEKEPRHVDALLYLAASYGYRAEYYNFLKNRWNKAYDDGFEMQELLKKAEKFPLEENIDVQLGYGLYNYYAHFYRKKIGWWRFVLSLPKGDKKKGLEQLQSVREKGTYFRTEAWYFLVDIFKRDNEFRDQAIPLCEELHQAYPENPYFHLFLAGLYHYRRDWPNSIRTATSLLERSGTSPYYSDHIIYQAKYVLGETAFFQGNYEEALQLFDEIIASQQPTPRYLLPWSHLRRGTIYDMTDKPSEATAEYQLVLKMNNVLQAHELAEEFLKQQKKQQDE